MRNFVWNPDRGSYKTRNTRPMVKYPMENQQKKREQITLKYN